jgi:hypothetical protein
MARLHVRSLGSSLAALYLLAVVGVEVLRRTTSWPHADDLASSPAGVAAGRVWPLVTSGLVVAGDPLVQLPALALTALAVVQIAGASAFWLAVAVAHLGSAVLAYVGVGVVSLASRASVDAVVDAPDYGVSCGWAGALGALLAAGLTRRRNGPRLPVAIAVALAASLALLAPADGLAKAEHALALALGFLVVAVVGPSGTRRSWAAASRSPATPASTNASR